MINIYEQRKVLDPQPLSGYLDVTLFIINPIALLIPRHKHSLPFAKLPIVAALLG